MMKAPFVGDDCSARYGYRVDDDWSVVEALRGMEAVAEHINEMQKIYEEYGHVFDELTHQYRDSHAHTRVNMFTRLVRKSDSDTLMSYEATTGCD